MLLSRHREEDCSDNDDDQQQDNNQQQHIPPRTTSTTSLSSTTNISTTNDNNTLLVNNKQQQQQQRLREDKIQEYKHIKPLSIDEISRSAGGGGRISYPSLDELLNNNTNNNTNSTQQWMSMIFPTPSAPPSMEEEAISYPSLSSLSDDHPKTYILPSIIHKKEEQIVVLPPLVIHKIQDGETLISISIKYGVTEESIKLRNRMMESDLTLYHKSELTIPEPTQLPTDDDLFRKKELTEEELRKIEERKKAWALTLFMKLCGVGEDEARYYLSVHDFDFREAVQEHKSDLVWEREYNEKMSKKKRAKQMSNFLDENPKLFTLLRFLSFCIPTGANNNNSSSSKRKKDKDVELDLIEEEDGVISYDSDYE